MGPCALKMLTNSPVAAVAAVVEVMDDATDALSSPLLPPATPDNDSWLAPGRGIPYPSAAKLPRLNTPVGVEL